MGLYNGSLADYYATPAGELQGKYQFVSIEDIINNFRVAYVGKDKIIPKISRADIRFHAMRGLQELSYDTFRSWRNLEIEVPNTLTFPLPHDYVNYTKISWVDSKGHCHTIRECKSCPKDPFSFEQNDDGTVSVTDANGDKTLPTLEPSTTWANSQSTPSTSTTQIEDQSTLYKNVVGARYGLDPQHMNTNGCFWIGEGMSTDSSPLHGKFYFDSSLAGKTIIIQYISDSASTDEEMVVHKFAEEAMYKHIAWAILNIRSNTDRNIVATYKKERFAAIRNAKLRLSNIKLEEITQILRGKSKWIKH